MLRSTDAAAPVTQMVVVSSHQREIAEEVHSNRYLEVLSVSGHGQVHMTGDADAGRAPTPHPARPRPAPPGPRSPGWK